MYFRSSIRNNPETGKSEAYYRLIESYRNTDDRVCHRTLLSIGFLPGVAPETLNSIQSYLNEWHENGFGSTLFEGEEDLFVREKAGEYWDLLVSGNRIDTNWKEKAKRMINTQTMTHHDVREIGSEWIAYSAWEQLGLDSCLRDHGFSDEAISLAATQVVSRAVYPASELATVRWIQENSAIGELTGYDTDTITKDKLYRGSLKLFQMKDVLEKHLSRHTNTLFDLQDRILLMDLTNSYFDITTTIKSKVVLFQSIRAVNIQCFYR